jgi:AraC-like DNA-binding protein
MTNQSLVVVTRDQDLIALLQMVPGIRVRIVPRIDLRIEADLLLVDPRTLPLCRSEPLKRWASAHTLPNRQTLHRSRARMVRTAWARREQVLSAHNRTPTIGRFLTFARLNCHRACAVSEAACELGLSIRHLHRLVVRELHFAPLALLSLARLASVTDEVLLTDHKLTTIAEGHGYRDLPSFDRHFRRIVGVAPGIYRRRGGQ